MILEVPISVGELFDKISILQIKMEYIKDNNKHIKNELEHLINVVQKYNIYNFLETDLFKRLFDINKSLWDICNIRHKLERNNDLNDEYIKQSYMEDKKNDERALVKFQINKMFDSEIFEVKEFDNIQNKFYG